jgi:hypothetical protein
VAVLAEAAVRWWLAGHGCSALPVAPGLLPPQASASGHAAATAGHLPGSRAQGDMAWAALEAALRSWLVPASVAQARERLRTLVEGCAARARSAADGAGA